MNRPELTRAQVEALLPTGYLLGSQPWLVGIRGFAGESVRNHWDDAIVIISKTFFATFTANTIPEFTRPGEATLKPGQWSYRHGIHNASKPPEHRYPALIQAATVTVTRDSEPGEFTGMFGINIHHGGMNETLSEGCQTIHLSQWDEFISAMNILLGPAETVPYLLVDRNHIALIASE